MDAKTIAKEMINKHLARFPRHKRATRLEELAAELKMSSVAFRRRRIGRTPWSADDMLKLTNATGMPDYADAMNKALIPDTDCGDENITEQLYHETMRMTVYTGKHSELLILALEDNSIDPHEHAKLQAVSNTIRRQIDKIEHCIACHVNNK